MTHLFYFIGLLFLIYEFYCLFNIKNKIIEGEMCKKFSEENPNTSYGGSPNAIKNVFLENLFIRIPYGLWLIIGITSTQGIMFLIYIFFLFGIIKTLKRIVEFSPSRFYVNLTESIISVLLISFIIINKYHLHIDTLSYIKNLFNI